MSCASTKSLYLYISAHQGREVVTKGGPRQVFMARNITNNIDDPIFSIPGDIAINWNYTNNGHRIVLTGGHLSARDSNDENTHGLETMFVLSDKERAEINANLRFPTSKIVRFHRAQM